LRHVQVNADKGADFAIENASNLLLDDVTSGKPLAGAPVLRLTKSQGAVLRDSRAFPGTEVFLSTGVGELKSVSLSGNTLENAKVPTEEH
jgi:hypothetical protein